jgi:hypothetical protein
MISTKDIPTGGGKTPKTLQPGNTTIKVNSIYLDKFPWGENAYNVMMDCEGVDLGPDFEGFFVNKDVEAEGRHAGQVGRVRASQWAYESKVLANGVNIDRDIEITKFLKNLCTATDCVDWLVEQAGKHETIESLVEKMNADAPFADKFIDACLGGREYENKAGYTNFDLFLPKYSKNGIPFDTAGLENSRVYKFNDSHIVKKKVKEVDDFAPKAETSNDEFMV